ncbi:type II secretion system F family protein [Massilia sp. R2A-15]|uniref:type II secretion system F family protein n=1 Tax=Massilia sp. R2A-15 TaxID=3064278 RepID=UPI0027377993|nr:type II secretion system F family protein [Massilia sp. R2A-15]WLI87753.1 type II secretion system F family protein [Massilia sp. R2A-15]
MDILYFLIIAAVFVAVVLLTRALWLLWVNAKGPGRVSLRQRIGAIADVGGAKQQVTLQQRRLSKMAWLELLMTRVPHIARLDRLLAQSATPLNAAQFIGASMVAGLTAGALALWLRLPVWGALLCALAGLGFPLWRALARHSKRMALIEQQLPGALDLISRALRAGHALPPAIEMVANELAPPLSHEFRIVFDEVSYGISMSEALKNLSQRVPSTDLGFFVVAVLIQRESGGNLTVILQNIATIVRDRLRLFGQVKVLSAEGRLSAWILGVLPFGLAAVLNLVNPGFMTLLWVDPVGEQMLKGMVVLMAAGVFWIRKIVRIKV